MAKPTGRPAGRPPRFKTPQELEKAAMEFFAGSITTDKDGEPVIRYVPTIMWMEYQLDFRFRDYRHKEGFSSLCGKIEKISHAIGEQLALRGKMAAPAIRMYLISKCGYTSEAVKVQSENINTIDITGVVETIQALDDTDRDIFLGQLHYIADGDEEDEDDEDWP